MRLVKRRAHLIGRRVRTRTDSIHEQQQKQALPAVHYTCKPTINQIALNTHQLHLKNIFVRVREFRGPLHHVPPISRMDCTQCEVTNTYQTTMYRG